MLRKFGLAAVLEFVDKGATAGLARVRGAAAAVQRQFAGMRAGAAQFSRGLASVALASVPVGLAFGLMVRDGMKFEQSIANLRAVTLDSTGESTEALTQLAKTLGATTKFSASQAGDAMTNLARAGFSVQEIMQAVPGTLNAAAAEGIDLATAADLVASNVRAFGLSAAMASEVAGTLALVSARTNTNMVGLQEGMKFAAPAARMLGWDVKETALALGTLSDIGIKNTLAGTALRQAIVRLTKPTKETLSVFGGRAGLNRVLMDAEGNIRPLSQVMLRMTNIIRKQPTVVKRAEVATKIFGVRAQSLGTAFDFSEERMEAFRRKEAELRAEHGRTAEVMRDIQIKTLGGQFVLLRSALESVNIELFGLLSGFTGRGVLGATDALGNLSLALRVVRGEKIVDPTSLSLLKKMPPIYLQIARGIRDGFDAAKSTLLSLLRGVKTLGRWLGIGGEDGARGIARVVTKVALLTAALGPATLVLGLLGKLAFGFGGMFVGGLRVLWGPLRLLMGPAGMITLLVLSLVDVKRVWEGLKQSVSASGVFGEVGAQLSGLKTELGNLLAAMLGVKGSSEGWKEFGRVVGATLATILHLIGKVIEGYRSLIALVNEFRAGGVTGALSQSLGGKGFHQGGPTAGDVAIRNAEQMAGQLAGLSERGVKTAGGRALTRGLAEERIAAFLRQQGFAQARVTEVLSRLDATLGRIGTPAGGKSIPSPVRDAAVRTGGYLRVSPGDVLLDRASLAAAVTSAHRGGLMSDLSGGALGGGDPGRASPPPAGSGGGTLRVEVPLTLDGREVARAVAEVQLDRLERSGRLRAGDRTRLLSGDLLTEGAR